MIYGNSIIIVTVAVMCFLCVNTFTGTDANFTVFTENITANSLDVGWDHKYIHCKLITVLLNSETILYCERLEPGTRSCHIEHLEPGTEYNVMVIAREHNTADDFAGLNVSTLGMCY